MPLYSYCKHTTFSIIETKNEPSPLMLHGNVVAVKFACVRDEIRLWDPFYKEKK